MRYRLILWFAVMVVQTHNINIDIVEKYFTSKRVVATTIFACSLKDYRKLFKILITSYMYVASGLTYLNENASFTHLMSCPYYRLGVYLDHTCDFGKQVMLKSSDSYILNSSYVWLIRINSTDEIYEFEDLNFGADSDATLVVDSSNNILDLIDLYKINSTSSLITTPAGHYTKETGLSIKLNGTVVPRRHDFKGFTFNTAVVVIDSNLSEFTDNTIKRFTDNSIEPEADTLSKWGFIICTYLAELYNFSVNVHPTPSFGYPIRTGPVLHNGEIGEIEGKVIDFGFTPTIMNVKSRLDVARYSVCPLWKYRLTFVFRHPTAQGTYKALINPFSTEVWIFIASLTLAISMVLAIIKYFDIDNSEGSDKSFTGNILIAIGALYQQGLLSYSNKTSERIVLIFTLLTGIMIVLFYNSMIVTSLLQPIPKYINTPTHLLESSFKLLLQNHTYVKHYFEKSTHPIVRKIYKKKQPGYIKYKEGLKLVQKSKYAFFSEAVPVYYIIEKTFSNDEICSLQEIDLERAARMYIPMQRNSPLTEYINQGLLQIYETGILQGQTNRWRAQKPTCKHLSRPNVELQSLLVAYFILISGVSLSLIVLLGEIIYKQYKMKSIPIMANSEVINLTLKRKL